MFEKSWMSGNFLQILHIFQVFLSAAKKMTSNNLRLMGEKYWGILFETPRCPVTFDNFVQISNVLFLLKNTRCPEI